MSKSNKISEDEVKKIAKLAKLKLTTEEIKLYSSQMSTIIGYISQLNEVDTSKIRPISNIIDTKNIVRTDKIQESLDKTISLKNAPDADEEFIKVPKIIRSK